MTLTDSRDRPIIMMMERVSSKTIIISFGASDQGKKRQNNEDFYLVDEKLDLFIVADGIGGSEGGEVASRIAVETLASVIPGALAGKDLAQQDNAPAQDDRELAALRLGVERANRNIREEQSRRPELADMGTTLTALLIRAGRVFLIHVGDSRAYLFRSGELSQISADHSLVAEYVRSGLLSAAAARTSPYRHVITRALGSMDEVAPDTSAQVLRKGDVLLLCTDGLTDMVSDKELAGILGSKAPREAVQELIAEANRGGGVDNITAVVIRIMETGNRVE